MKKQDTSKTKTQAHTNNKKNKYEDKQAGEKR